MTLYKILLDFLKEVHYHVIATNFGELMNQFYKSVSYPKALNKSKETKILKLAFNKNDKTIINLIKDLNSSQMRSLLNFKSYEDLEQQAVYDNRSLNNTSILLIKDNIKRYKINSKDQIDLFVNENFNKINITEHSATFENNKNKGVFNWYPYIEGFSYDFVEEILKDVIIKPKFIFDPFAGTGTTILVASLKNIKSAFSEINPLMRFIIETKINSLLLYRTIIKPNLFYIDSFLNKIKSENYNALKINDSEKTFINKDFFRKDILSKLLFIKNQIQTSDIPNIFRDIFKLSLASIIVKESNMIRRSDLRYKRKNELFEIEPDVFNLFNNKVNDIINDLKNYENGKNASAYFISNNAINISDKFNSKFDLIVTSPPYVNGTNYFRNTKLELLLLDFIKNENDLKLFRTDSIAAGINDVSNRRKEPNKLSYVEPIVIQLDKNKYDPRIPKLIQFYFSDMKKVFTNIYNIITDNGDFYIDIGDSKFNNVHIPTDILFEKIADEVGLELINKNKIRNRFSKDGSLLGQWLLHFKRKKSYSRKKVTNNNFNYPLNFKLKENSSSYLIYHNWEKFRDELPYRKIPYIKRNWGNGLHSLCSYQGKLKPSIAHFLIKYFTIEKMHVLDPLSGIGTIPFEARLLNRIAYGNDLSLIAYSNTLSKLGEFSKDECIKLVNKLNIYINKNKPSNFEIQSVDIDFNKNILEYYHTETFKEIFAARNFFKEHKINNANEAIVFSSILHILHGNRPYALSRTSHPITPFAPKGEYIYKNLYNKLNEKLNRVIKDLELINNKSGFAFMGDYKELSHKIKHKKIDAIITSPPFFDSTKFFMANWIRMWFAGWDKQDFNKNKNHFIETKQVKSIDIYDDFFNICNLLLKMNGSVIMHLGFSYKANMAELLIPYAKKYFNVIGYFNESVSNNNTFGISDQGSVKSHQFLFLIKN